jgi:hypothetical protein
VRRVAGLAAALAVVVLAGCDDTKKSKPGPPKPDYALADEAVVRLWTKALYDGHYRRAASFFAPRAIVQQGTTRVLKTRAEAIAFNRSLTCRATVGSIHHEKNRVLLVRFNLGPGPGGGCSEGGTARVRFFIRGGLIETWHQLPEPGIGETGSGTES